MNKRRLVLDTNAFRGLRREEVERLAERGFTFVISETALSETMAASVREFERGLSRDRARGLFFKRAKLFARHVDDAYPVAAAGSIAIERIRAEATGQPVSTDNLRHVEYLQKVWRVLVGIEPLDEEWIAAGREAEIWLAAQDAALHRMARRYPELWNKVEEPVEEKKRAWFALSEEEQLGQIREYLRTTWNLDDATADRLDGHTRFCAWRLHQAAYGREMTKENDAPDLRFLVHLGEGFLLLSSDASFVRLVDESRTYQASWVRRVRDLTIPSRMAPLGGRAPARRLPRFVAAREASPPCPSAHVATNTEGPIAATLGTTAVSKPLLPQPVGRQREVLYLPAGGHTVVLGTAGSGKTTMAMHRAVHLADPSTPHGGKTLLLSFNNTLLRYFESFANLDGANIDVRTYHHFARGYLNTRGRMSYGAICGPDERLVLVQQAVQALSAQYPQESVLAKPVGFLTEEIKWLAQHGIATAAEYAEAERTGREGARLQRKDRALVYALYERYREVRASAGKQYDWDDLANTVVEEIPDDDRPRMYRHIVIDEGQDFSPMMLQSLAALTPNNGSLTFFGDMAQQIYGNKLSWRSAGLKVSKVWEFKENYRNTRQVAALALAIAEMPYFAGTPNLVAPNAPSADGPLPALVSCSSPSVELAFAARQAKQLSNAGSVAILLRTREEEDAFASRLPSGSTRLHRDLRQWRHGPGVFYGTYAAAKGLEFDAVILPRLDGGEFPTLEDVATFGAEDAATIAGHQLYVGVTRARATLILTHSGTVTPLLPTKTALYDRSVA